MFERFTDRARRTLVLAQEEARRLQDGEIGTEHMLLGLLRLGEGIAVEVLGALGVSLPLALDKLAEMQTEAKSARGGPTPFSAGSKKALELALRAALELGHNYLGTEHLLIGIVREGNGRGVRLLEALGVDLGGIGEAVSSRLAQVTEQPARPTTPWVKGAPFCPSCGGSLEGNLAFRELSAAGEAPSTVAAFLVPFCARCGTAVQATEHPGGQGQAVDG